MPQVQEEEAENSDTEHLEEAAKIEVGQMSFTPKRISTLNPGECLYLRVCVCACVFVCLFIMARVCWRVCVTDAPRVCVCHAPRGLVWVCQCVRACVRARVFVCVRVCVSLILIKRTRLSSSVWSDKRIDEIQRSRDLQEKEPEKQ